MNLKFGIKRLKFSFFVIVALIWTGVIECPSRVGHITFRNYTECAIELYVDTIHITTLKQNGVEHWDIRFFPPPILTLSSSSNEKRNFEIGPYYDSIKDDTAFFHIYQVEGRIADSVIARFVFPYLEKLSPNMVFPRVDTVLVFGEKK